MSACVSVCACVCVCVHVFVCVCAFTYLLQVTLPEFEFSGQSLFVSIQSRFMSLTFRNKPVVVDNRI